MMNVIEIGSALNLAFGTLEKIAKKKRTSVRSVSINALESNLAIGKIVGLVTVKNRSRKPFTVEANGHSATLSFMGEKLSTAL